MSDNAKQTLYILDVPERYCPGCVEVMGLLTMYKIDIPVVKEPDWETRPIVAERFGEREGGRRWPLPILELPSDYKAPPSIRELIQITPNGQKILVEEKAIAKFFHEEYGIPRRAGSD